LGSVCAKHVFDETNEMSYLDEACEVNLRHFLFVINSSLPWFGSELPEKYFDVWSEDLSQELNKK
jgi:hypothetical protein